MPDSQTIWLFCLAATALIVIPGPAVLYVVAQSVGQGRKAGLVSASGVATGGALAGGGSSSATFPRVNLRRSITDSAGEFLLFAVTPPRLTTAAVSTCGKRAAQAATPRASFRRGRP